jgi:hypothetical protein
MLKQGIKSMNRSLIGWVLLCLSLSAQAASDNTASSVKVNLGPAWKVLNTREENKAAHIVFYTKNSDSSNPEELIETHAMIPAGAKNFLVHNMYAPVRDVLSKHHCKIDDMFHPPVNGKPNQYGFIWQCKKNMSSGFMLFMEGDAKTCYSFAYKKANGFPVTEKERNYMLTLIKSIQICYQGKSCFSAQ